jgi:hypothetical protein
MTASLPPPSDHFQGKNVVDHLKDARTKGAMAAREIHGTEMSGHLAAGADAAKETAIILVILAFLFNSIGPLLIFLSGWFIWKIGRSALLGWSRLERLHRLIEEERYEIEHHRAQEKEELREMYAAKGFSGKLLDQVVDILMADDNRLLKVMLEEELGVTLESMEHPLKQAIGAGVGVAAAGLISIIGWHLFGVLGLCLGAALSLFIATIVSAKAERNRSLNATLWTFAIAILAISIGYFLRSL